MNREMGILCAVGVLLMAGCVAPSAPPDRGQATPLRTTDALPQAHSTYVNEVIPAPDGRTLVSLDSDGVAKIWSLPRGLLQGVVRTDHSSGGNVAVIPPGDLLLTHDWETARLWDLPDARLRHEFPVAGTSAMAVSPDGRLLALCSRNNDVALWSLPDGESRTRLAGHDGIISFLAISPDGQMLVSASREDRTMRAWSIPRGTCLAVLRDGEATPGPVAISRDWAFVSVGVAHYETKKPPYEHEILLWSLPEGKLMARIPRGVGDMSSLAIGGDGSILAANGSRAESAVTLWKFPGGELLRTIPGYKGANPFTISPDGGILAVGCDDYASTDARIQLVSLPDGRPLGTLQGHTSRVKDLAFTPDGVLLVSCGADRRVILWDVKRRCLVRSLGRQATDRQGGPEPHLDSAWAAADTSSERIRLLLSWDEPRIVNGGEIPVIYLSRKYLVGKPVSEAVRLLGEPDTVEKQGTDRIYNYACADELDGVRAHEIIAYEEMQSLVRQMQPGGNVSVQYVLTIRRDRITGFELRFPLPLP